MINWAIFSDLHIEGSNFKPNLAGADAAIFAGDIYALGPARMDRPTVIDWMAEHAPDIPVIFVPGNHDFEHAIIDEQVEIWKEISHKRYDGRIHVLMNEVVDIGDVRVIGTPLFTNFDAFGQAKMCRDWARDGVIDFRRIFKNKDEFVTPEDYARYCMDAVAFLTDELFRVTPQKKLVVTHFAPSVIMRSDRVRQSFADAYWVNSFDHLVRQAHLWVSGHTHQCARHHLGDDPDKGLLVSNARGYSKVFGISPDPQFQNGLLVPLGSSCNLKKNLGR